MILGASRAGFSSSGGEEEEEEAAAANRLSGVAGGEEAERFLGVLRPMRYEERDAIPSSSSSSSDASSL